MNAFERHGMKHLSASSCNSFAVSPALWVMERLLKRSAPVGAAAHRGTAVEAGIAKGLLDPDASVEDCIAEAEQVFRNKTALSPDPRRDKEAEGIPDMVRVGLSDLRPYGPAVECQRKIEWHTEDLPVPFIGYIDFYWPDSGVLIDLKTTHRIPSSISTSHARQVGLYTGTVGDNVDARVAYVGPKKSAVYGLENARAHTAALVAIGKAIERFLSVSDDPMELAGLVVPDVDHFFVSNPVTRQHVFETFGV